MQKETKIQGMLMCLLYLGHLCLDLVSQHRTPKNLAKSQALYKIKNLENIQVSSLCL